MGVEVLPTVTGIRPLGDSTDLLPAAPLLDQTPSIPAVVGGVMKSEIPGCHLGPCSTALPMFGHFPPPHRVHSTVHSTTMGPFRAAVGEALPYTSVKG